MCRECRDELLRRHIVVITWLHIVCEKPAQELGVAVYSRDPKLSLLYRKKLSLVENDGYGAPVNLYCGFYYIPCNSITFEETVLTTVHVVVQYTIWMTDYTDTVDLSMCFYGIHYTD